MVANAIAVICTGLIVGAVIWVLIAEHNAPDYDEDKKKGDEEKKDSEDKQ